VQGVFDGQFVQPELLGDQVEVRGREVGLLQLPGP
jgi:hypothetical protein